MRTALGLLLPVVMAACGGTPPPSSIVVQERDASATPIAAPSGKPLPDAPTPEVAALRKCDASGSDPQLMDAPGLDEMANLALRLRARSI